MNTSEPIGLMSARRLAIDSQGESAGVLCARRPNGERGEIVRFPLEVILLATTVAYAVIGALTDPVWAAVVTTVFVTVLTFRRARAEVRDLRGGWAGAPDLERHV
jgi:hypothetical protein